MQINDYSKYKFEDFLADDYFIRTIVFSTKESASFWDELIDRKAININEFISASMLIISMQKERQSIPQERIDSLRIRIDNTMTSTKKHKKIDKYKKLLWSVCAAVAIFAGVFFFFFYPNKSIETDYTVLLQAQLQQTSEIQILSGNKQMNIAGENVDIKYDASGTLSVDQINISEPVVNPQTNNVISYSQLSVPYGKRATLTLSDGSVLWLNTGTTVIYPTVFPNDKREIYVKGEIYAEVEKDKTKPFIVKTDYMQTLVLGTSFDLSAYNEDNEKRVVLVTGTVDIKYGGNSVRLNPNQAYICNNKESEIKNVDVYHYTSWRDGIYIFENESIENILLKLARFHNVTIVLPKQPSRTICSGKLELKEDLSIVMNGLSEIGHFNYSIKDNQFWIQFR